MEELEHLELDRHGGPVTQAIAERTGHSGAVELLDERGEVPLGHAALLRRSRPRGEYASFDLYRSVVDRA
jgi:hypothetical protein